MCSTIKHTKLGQNGALFDAGDERNINCKQCDFWPVKN